MVRKLIVARQGISYLVTEARKKALESDRLEQHGKATASACAFFGFGNPES